MEFDDYTSCMVYCEGVAVQSEVVVKPHIMDTALMFLGFCNNKHGQALQAQAAASIDATTAEDDLLNQAFRQCMTGKAKHRLSDAKVVLRLLRRTKPEVVQFVAMWRKKAHFCHASTLAQQWFLSWELHGLRG